MKFLKIFIFFTLIISCSDKKSENEISEFNNILGKENINLLDFLVSDFENDFLKKQYPNLGTENAYRQFLIELRDNKTENWGRISQKARDKFKSSDLRLEMYVFPDSVWIIEDSTLDKIESDSIDFIKIPAPYVKSRFKYTNTNGTIEYTYTRGNYGEIMPNSDFDSIINQELNTAANFNYIGKYLQALESVKNKSEFHKEFYEQKKSAGYLFADEVARKMIDYNINLNDKINKKIIVLELVY